MANIPEYKSIYRYILDALDGEAILRRELIEKAISSLCPEEAKLCGKKLGGAYTRLRSSVGIVINDMEKKGIISNRCELNRQIKADNALLRDLKATVRKLMQAVKNTIPAIAEAMETIRQNVIIFCYQLRSIRTGQRKLKTYISDVKSEMKQYSSLVEQIREKSKERKSLLAEQKELPF